MPSYSLYIVQCADGSLYTGIAADVPRRLKEHAGSPRGARYLRGRGPLELVFSEPVGSRSRAQRLEACVKKLSRAGKLGLIAGTTRLSALADEGQVPMEDSSP